jgi:ribosomal-protein-alanine N-acetyltransferase
VTAPDSTVNTPIVETNRLWLRELTPGDVTPLLAALGDAESMRYYPKPFDREMVEAWVARNRERYAQDGFGLWAMVLKATGEVIGDCGLMVQEVDGAREVEVGYHVRRDRQNQGLATEAARARMEYGVERLGLDRIISLIRPENLPSRRVAEKNGLTIEKEVGWKGLRHYVYVAHRKM